MSENIRLSSWSHPQLAEPVSDEGLPDCRAYYTAFAGVDRLRAEIRRLHEDTSTWVDGKSKPNYNRIADHEGQKHWLEQEVKMHSPVFEQYQAQLQARIAAVDEANKPLRAAVNALRRCDTELTALTQKATSNRRLEAQLEEELVQVRREHGAIQQAINDKRDEWGAKAEAVGFPGKPTVDLPPRKPLSQAMRYEKSLIVGVNATDADVAKRRSFEAAIA